ncbi:SURF1 family protein [Acuticoccus sp. MNP-M23]|uniref:SURF1 family protein n=1 Tax=Acuticoccus sp. MNP-M23 TaxID=3072793 RepID=UPI002815C963|nr:SURF1 family protein [Acuticoccus sp. MNP-M23]WMS43866.1 SURF1 family protein [Acuticoccus sp. MNP-M23]
MTRTTGARVVLALLTAAAFAVLISLGVWQLQRLAWKEALIAAATERPTLPAIAAPGPDIWSDFSLDDWNYRRIRLTGTFGPGEAYAWTNLSEPRGGDYAGAGYFVVAPFTTTDGWSVLVNRGFVPDGQQAPGTRPGSGPVAGVVTVEGLIRRNDPPNFVTPAPDLETMVWFSRDIPGMMAAFDRDPARTAPYSVDLVAAETPAGGLPQAGESHISFANSHLQYALTWFGLAAALVGVVIAALWRRRRKSPEA